MKIGIRLDNSLIQDRLSLCARRFRQRFHVAIVDTGTPQKPTYRSILASIFFMLESCLKPEIVPDTFLPFCAVSAPLDTQIRD